MGIKAIRELIARTDRCECDRFRYGLFPDRYHLMSYIPAERTHSKNASQTHYLKCVRMEYINLQIVKKVISI